MAGLKRDQGRERLLQSAVLTNEAGMLQGRGRPGGKDRVNKADERSWRVHEDMAVCCTDFAYSHIENLNLTEGMHASHARQQCIARSTGTKNEGLPRYCHLQCSQGLGHKTNAYLSAEHLVPPRARRFGTLGEEGVKESVRDVHAHMHSARTSALHTSWKASKEITCQPKLFIARMSHRAK